MNGSLQVSLPNAPKQIPIDTIINLADQGKNNMQIAEIVGCSDVNVFHRLSSWGYTKNRPAQIDKTKKTVLGLIQARFINAIRQDEIEKAPIQTKIWSIGVLQDKIDNLERKAQGIVHDDSALDDLSSQLSRIASRSPIVINNILNVVGNLPAEVRDRINALIPQSLPDGRIIEGQLSDR